MIYNNEKHTISLLNIAISAGERVMKHYSPNLKIYEKKDKSPLTEADLESNDIIISKLKLLNENIPILSEEMFVDWNERKKWDKYWLIDPLDGTKEFINLNGEFTINIALIEDHIPIFGIIYSPVNSTLYYAFKNHGSFKIISNKKITSLRNAKKIFCNKKNKYNNLIIISSRSHNSIDQIKWLKKKYVNYKILEKGSSIKFCYIAEGLADLYPRFGPTSEWDIAAGNIILQEAGGLIRDFEGKKILYNNKESVINPSFVAYCNIDLFIKENL